MDAGHFRAAAEPLGPLGPIPQSAHEFPRFRTIVRTEEPAGKRSSPQSVLLFRRTRFECPDHLECGWNRRFAVATREGLAFGIGRSGAVFPGRAAVGRELELHAEMAKVERRIPTAV